MHHLLIMEELGGNEKYFDRFISQHSAFFYYWFIVFCYIANPTLAYNLNQAIEEHAFDTYDQFLDDFEVELKREEAPEIAKQYYKDGDMYLFDEMHTCSERSELGKDYFKTVDGETKRRPRIDNLYDVFLAIRDDEAEHAKTMEFLQRQDSDIQICDL